VVDDDKLIRDFLVDTLMFSVNREILHFDNGLSAWEHINSNNGIDIVISDASIPDISGLKLLKLIKQKYPSNTFIIVSADPANKRKAQEMGADAFLAKPFGTWDIFDIVQKFVVE